MWSGDVIHFHYHTLIAPESCDMSYVLLMQRQLGLHTHTHTTQCSDTWNPRTSRLQILESGCPAGCRFWHWLGTWGLRMLSNYLIMNVKPVSGQLSVVSFAYLPACLSVVVHSQCVLVLLHLLVWSLIYLVQCCHNVDMLNLCRLRSSTQQHIGHWTTV